MPHVIDTFMAFRYFTVQKKCFYFPNSLIMLVGYTIRIGGSRITPTIGSRCSILVCLSRGVVP